MKLLPVPLTLREANAFVRLHHRHNKPVRGARFAIGALRGNTLVGVGICGRPISRMQQRDKLCAEVTRVCVIDEDTGLRPPGHASGSCSFLYAAIWRAWRAMGGTRLITYTLQSESGTSLKAMATAGWRVLHEIAASNASGWANRAGRGEQEVTGQAKICWQVAA